MPFDSPRKWENLTPAERCRSFADELEAWEKMGAVFPDGKKWDFSRCDMCAMGYAVATRGLSVSDEADEVIAYRQAISTWLLIPEYYADRIFGFQAYSANPNARPSDIARLLREHADTLDG